MQSFIIEEKLPSRNEAEGRARTNKYFANKVKAEVQTAIRGYALKSGLKRIERPCVIICEFTEGNRRRDVDNVESSVKYILDALVKGGWLENDNPAHVVAVPTFTEYGCGCQVKVTIAEGEPEHLREIVKKGKNEIIESLKETENANQQR